MTVTFVILTLTILLFISGKLRPDIVALLSMLSLYVFGILTVQEAFSGFSNTTVVMIAGLFVVGEALSRTGVTAWIGNKIVALSQSNSNRLLILLILGAAIISGFISNTGTVASLIPVAIASAWRLKTPASKMLIPLAFAANTGGLLTLTGTPPNIIADQAMRDAGFPGFSFFEYALIGIPLLIALVLYMRYLGIKILPSNSSNKREDIDASIQNLEDAYQIFEGFWKVRIRPSSNAIGKTLRTLHLDTEMGISVLKIIPKKPTPASLLKKLTPSEDEEFLEESYNLRMNDELIVNCSEKRIQRLIDRYNVAAMKIAGDGDFVKENVLSDELGLSELIVAPRSTSTLSQIMSNSATAILMAPIIINAALQLGYHPAPFMMILAVSASTAFLTPFGTTTNMMVMNAGNYSFKDYLKIGSGLLGVFFVISIILIPILWPFY